ncbi:MAG: hypothetical protein H9535_12110 [Ignavibacteria bacterium]|nr:hypothetical protein [Ignavibacteria bacterium]
MLLVASDVSYVSDGNGNTTAVLVPIHVWRAMKQELVSNDDDNSENHSDVQKYSKTFYEFAGDRALVRLHYPAYCDVEVDEEGVAISYLPLNVHGCGANEQEAITDMAQELEYLYQHSLQQDDEHLTEYAKKIKYGTLLLVKEIVHGES